MASNLNRITSLTTLIGWLDANFPVGATVRINRNDIAHRSGVSVDYVNKSMLVLVQNGYIRYVRHRNDQDVHGLLKPITDVTGEMLHKWITTYQVEWDRKRRESIRQQLAESANTLTVTPSEIQQDSPGIFDIADQRKGYTFEGSEHNQPEAPKTRSQQLLEEAKRLQDEAQKEAQREEEEAQQAKQAASEPVASEQPGTLPEMLTMFDTRLEAMDGRINAMVYFFEQAGRALRGLAPVGPEPAQPVSEPTPPVEPTTRALLVRLVNSYAAADRKPEHDTWKWLYAQFDLRTGFNVYAEAPNKVRDQSYLAVIEERGQIDTLYEMAKKLFVLQPLR